MKEITSKKTKLVQVVSDKTWEWITRQGWSHRFTVRQLPERPLKDTPPKLVKPKAEKAPKK